MRIFKRAFIISIFLVFMVSSSCLASPKYNVFLMGDSIIDNYPHSKAGLAEYMAKDSSFVVRCDYSYEGSILCDTMLTQTKKVIKQLNKYQGKNNVIVYSFGANDYFKKCTGDHYYNLVKCIKRIRVVDTNVKIIAIVPTHIYRVRNDKQIQTIFNYTTAHKYLKNNVITIKTGDYFKSSDIRTDCLHPTGNGYIKTVKKIKEALK